ncbi:MAG: L,D-transpeptidase family protein [Parvibaculum sp.]|uniref:L,D-transpeptidase family protein n=1 Tax=Parvibaculum sp. TaxID=2024848 RepID=UPI0025CF5BBA|nr:L,D-transpeptidase family protein [Parvibaculum sp.]MCE9650089.1 L,D-transpeptidase family protein [Parvibaculum sp.]
MPLFALRRLSFIVLIAAGLVAAHFGSTVAAGPLRPDTLPKADRIVIHKSKRELDLMAKGAVIRTYPIALGPHPVGPKRLRKDGRTPEGLYVIDRRTRATPYHRALHISYPDAADVARARAKGGTPGGDIFIHGMPAYFGRTDPVRFFVDWTNGCIAVGNIAIEEIWQSVDDGTPVEILP